MVCVCCVSLPQVAIVLCTTAIAIVAGSRTLFQNRKVSSCVSHAFAMIVMLLAGALTALDNHPGMRKFAFAKMCQKLSSTPELDELRCHTLGLGEVGGDVIEFGPGPGTNYRCWGADDVNHTGRINRWVGVDPNEEFATMQDAEAKNRNATYFPRESVWLRGEDVAVEAGTFDAAVLTHVLCSVTDPAVVLSQAARALKPGGKVYILEHVTADEGTWVRYAQHLVSPVFFIAFNGCNFRDTASILRADRSGFEPFDIQNVQAPMPIAIIKPHVIATAVKKA